jgi:hypothetical protein
MQYRMSVSYGQFYLEPRIADSNLQYVDIDRDGNTWFEQQFTAFPGQVAFFIPDEIWDTDVTAELSSSLPAIDLATQAISVPIDVESPEGLYLRGPEYDGDHYRLDVPTGKYDVVVRFFPPEKCEPIEGEDADEDEDDDDGFLTYCKIALTFLPQGTVGPSILKAASGNIPELLLLHRGDGSSYTVPNGGVSEG